MLDDMDRDDAIASLNATIEELKRDLGKAQRIADLFRQQRDAAVRAVQDLQVELSEARYEIDHGGRPNV